MVVHWCVVVMHWCVVVVNTSRCCVVYYHWSWSNGVDNHWCWFYNFYHMNRSRFNYSNNSWSRSHVVNNYWCRCYRYVCAYGWNWNCGRETCEYLCVCYCANGQHCCGCKNLYDVICFHMLYLFKCSTFSLETFVCVSVSINPKVVPNFSTLPCQSFSGKYHSK